MYPHERSLVKKLAKERFVLLGVNSDETPTKLRAAMKRENLTWPVIFDGGGIAGPISTKWGVRGWPTTYVIDKRGVIRFKNVRDESMTSAVKQLLAEKADRQR
jgi:peroxiredoxin